MSEKFKNKESPINRFYQFFCRYLLPVALSLLMVTKGEVCNLWAAEPSKQIVTLHPIFIEFINTMVNSFLVSRTS